MSYHVKKIGACPFCYEEKDLEVLSDVSSAKRIYYFVFCNACQAQGPKSRDNETAIFDWNYKGG